jgi:hypothetical protein
MKKLLLGMLLVLSTQTVHAAIEEEGLMVVEELIENSGTHIKSFRSKQSKKSKDILASLVGKDLESSQGADILPTGEIRNNFHFTLTVLTADTNLGLYRVKLKTEASHIPVKDEDIFVIGRIGEDYTGHGTQIDGAQQIFIRRVGNHLEVTLSDIYTLFFQPPIIAQQRAIFPLPRKFR